MTENTPSGSIRSDTLLIYFLRLIGGVSLTAIIFVAVPYSWMNTIHQALDLGTLPDAPIVGYLARSTSAFYAMSGALMWVVSFDLDRHRVVIRYIAVAMRLFGAALLIIDLAEGLPLSWTLSEGPLAIIFGFIISYLNRSAAREKSE